MLVGTAAAIAHGAAFPIAMLIFGDITNAFVNHDASRELANSNTVNFSGLTVRNITGGVVNCSTTYLPGTELNFTLSDLLARLISDQFSCLESDEFIAEVNRLTYIFIGIACGAFLVAIIQTWTFQTAAERQVYRLTLRFYRAVLRQDVSWFDVNPAGEISTAISE